jgi:nucleoside-diphosphate-sugar epimerase
MKVLVTGTEGYIGAVLTPLLAGRGHHVDGLDTCFYTGGLLYPREDGFETALRKDIREIEAEDLAGYDAVVHMAELSNDPLGQLNPEVTYRINHEGSLRMARKCLEAGVQRFVYTSSCSVYGVAESDLVDETSEPNPQTAYARCKVLVERDVGAMADDDFSPTFLRNATAFGPSPRMRFDIVLNNLAGLAWTTGQIKLISDGTPWRPLVHVEDIARAIACSIEAPREAVHGKVFNVGDSEQNYRIREVAEIVSEALPGCRLTIGESDGDNRSYRVSFEKINGELPGFRCEKDARTGARELMEVFERIDLSREVFEAPPFTRLRELEKLLAAGELDGELLWTEARPAVTG